jgi:DNA modification methylase
MTFIDVILEGDNTETLKKLPDKSIDCCITSPPYFMQRRYSDSDAEIGGEDFPMEYANRICDVFDERYGNEQITGCAGWRYWLRSGLN